MLKTQLRRGLLVSRVSAKWLRGIARYLARRWGDMGACGEHVGHVRNEPPVWQALALQIRIGNSDSMSNELKEPKASVTKAAYHQKQLRKLFPRASDQQFLQLTWAISMLRSGHSAAAARLLNFPRLAVDQSVASRLAVHPWELETLLIQLFLTPREAPQTGATAMFDCSKFESIAELVNRLRKLEDVESAIYLRGGGFNIFGELHRIAQRQFHWQRGYLNLPQFYRYAFIYAQGKCGEYFERTYGLPIAELNLSRDGKRIVVQCKFYSKPVGNKAVQEAAAARLHEHADKAIVVSNAAYTKAARRRNDRSHSIAS
jgi:hypothetical protein